MMPVADSTMPVSDRMMILYSCCHRVIVPSSLPFWPEALACHRGMIFAGALRAVRKQARLCQGKGADNSDPAQGSEEQPVKELIVRHKQPGISWHTVVNNHASSRPKCHGGPLWESVTKCKTFDHLETPGSASVVHCTFSLRDSFQPGVP